MESYLAKVLRVSFITRCGKQYAEITFRYYATRLLFPTEQLQIVTLSESDGLWEQVKNLKAGDELKAHPHTDEIVQIKKHNAFMRWFLLNCQYPD